MPPKRIYTRIYSDIHRDVVITRHALLQAIARGIAYPDQVEMTIRTGKRTRIGKGKVRIVSRDGTTCIGEITPTHIVIITIERGNRP